MLPPQLTNRGLGYLGVLSVLPLVGSGISLATVIVAGAWLWQRKRQAGRPRQ